MTVYLTLDQMHVEVVGNRKITNGDWVTFRKTVVVAGFKVPPSNLAGWKLNKSVISLHFKDHSEISFTVKMKVHSTCGRSENLFSNSE
jgi:hypothetical protein